MENRKILNLILLTLLCYTLFPSTAISTISSQTSVRSQGNIFYSVPAKNLAVIPDDWHLPVEDGGLGTQQTPYLDYNFKRTPDSSPSICIAPHVPGVDPNECRECDGKWYQVKPGDHIVASIWIYAGDSGSGLDESDLYTGGKLGFDYYIKTDDYVWGVVEAHPRLLEHEPSMVDWGSKTWTKKTWDVIVPDTYYDTIAQGGWPLTWSTLEVPLQISWMVLWVDVKPVDDTGTIWFSDAEFYINP